MRGRFFCIDKSSLQDEGQVIFRYLPVCDYSDAENRHPVYLTIKPYAVDFFFHGKNVSGAQDASGNHIVNTCIMRLPLSMNLAVKDNLSFTLRKVYQDDYKIKQKQIKLTKNKAQAYWNLDIFHHDAFNHQEDDITLSLRNLLLDFLFDMEHSSVFEASPSYEIAEVHLKENFFLSAIAAKASYYYLRKMYEIADKKGGADNSSEKRIYAFQMKDAEIQWLNTIRDVRARELFGEGCGWFKTVEEEYKPVLFNFEGRKWRRHLYPITPKNHDNSIDGAKKNFLRRVKAKLRNEKPQYGNEEDIENLRILRESARWFLRRYDPRSGMKALWQYKKCKNNEARIIIFGVAVLILFFLIGLNWGALIKENQVWPSIFVYALISICFLPLAIIVVFRKLSVILTVFGILMPRLIMATASAWLVFISTEELWKVSLDQTLNLTDLMPAILLLVPVVVFMAIEIRNIATEISGCQLAARLTSVLLIGFLYSVIIGAFFIGVGGEKMLTRSGYLSEAVQSFSKSDKFEITGQLKEAVQQNKKLTDSALYERLKDVRYNLFGHKINLKYEIPFFSKEKTLDFFPGMLLYRAIFALFFGIFIQLIFEDKPITEPL